MKQHAIDGLSTGVVEQTNPKALYEQMDRCTAEAKHVLALAEGYRRTIRAGEDTYSWDACKHLWKIEKNNEYTNYIPLGVAVESLSYHLFKGEDWSWDLY